MDGIAHVGSVVGRVATYAFDRKESALVADCGSILADVATVRAQELSNCPTGDDHEH